VKVIKKEEERKVTQKKADGRKNHQMLKNMKEESAGK
jgi:hypothetical protein